MSASKETIAKTLTVVISVCFVCAIIVASAAIGLREDQQRNALLDKQTKILEAAGLIKAEDENPPVAMLFDNFIEAKVLDLDTNQFVENIDAKAFDQYRAARKDGMRPEDDFAKIIIRPNKVSIYLVKDEQGHYSSMVLPINGSGLWGMMKAFIGIERDGSTIRSLVYYEHQETPGLGAEILNPKWKAQWVNKKLFDEQGQIKIQLVKGGTKPGNIHGVDALTGATLTSNGVQNTLNYWLSGEGFGPYLKKVRSQGLSNG